jgi:hypothetical protein
LFEIFWQHQLLPNKRKHFEKKCKKKKKKVSMAAEKGRENQIRSQLEK